MKKLPSLISSTDMLVCGEDLGMIPSCVPSAMNSLSILSLEIERMPKNPELKFGKTLEYPYLSVCTTGTHDTSTLRGWWEEDRSISNEYFKTILNETGEAPYYCEPWICKKIINNHLTSNSMLAIIPLQDWLSLSSALRRENPHTERINIPANPKHYWKYRVHLNIEEISNDTQFITEISEIIKCSGR
jgi:4-alpha-glucanotransferase